MAFLDDYEPVEDRLAKFWADHPNGKVLTDLVHQDGERFIVKAFVYKEAPQPVDTTTMGELPTDRTSPDATGYAQEIVGQGNVNKTSALENCETSAIGRALANLGYAPKGQRPSREEMAKVERQDVQIDPADWLAGRVKIFEKWTEEQARETAAQVAKEVGAKKPISQDEAEQVYEQMKSIYLEAFPVEDGEEVPF